VRASDCVLLFFAIPIAALKSPSLSRR
jgi:hypothetical protein